MSDRPHRLIVRLGIGSERNAREVAGAIGRTIRDSREAVGWSQQALADRVGISQSTLSRVETGRIAAFDLEVVLAVAHELGVRPSFALDPSLVADRRSLRDPVHARCVAYVARNLGSHGWLGDTEVEVGRPPWLAWIDVLAFHPSTASLLIQEVKTEIHDAGGEQRRLGRYERDAAEAARIRGWQPRRVASGIALLATDRNDERLAELAAWARIGFPVRSAALADWLRSPSGPLPGRTLTMIDPLSRRADWLRPTRFDGRRTSAAYRDYAEVASLLRRRR